MMMLNSVTAMSDMKSIRQQYQPLIEKYSKTIDYYSEQWIRTGDINFYLFYEHNKKLVSDLKEHILNEEDKLRVSSGSDGGLQQGAHDFVEDSGVEYFGHP